MRIAATLFSLLLGLVSAIAPASAETAPPASEPFAPVALAFHPRSNTLVLARGSDGLRLIDFADPGNPVARAPIASKAMAAAFLVDGARIVTGGADGMLRFWSLDGTEAGAPIRASAAPIAGIVVSPRGGYIAAVDETLAIRLWRADGSGFGRPLNLPRQRGSFPCTRSDVAFSPDESLIAAISCTNTVMLWRVAGQPMAVPGGREGYEACCGVRIGFTADGRFLVASRSFQPGFTGYIWPVRNGRPGAIREFPGTTSLRAFAALPDGLLILDEAGLRRLDPAGRALGEAILRGEEAANVQIIAVSADAMRIATIESGDAILLRAADGAALGRFPPLSR